MQRVYTSTKLKYLTNNIFESISNKSIVKHILRKVLTNIKHSFFERTYRLGVPNRTYHFSALLIFNGSFRAIQQIKGNLQNLVTNVEDPGDSLLRNACQS